MTWTFGTYVIIYGLYLKQTQLLCVIWRYRLWAACPRLSWSAAVFRRPIGVEFMTECKFALACVQIRSFNLNIQYMATSKQTYIHTYIHTRITMQSR